MATLVDTNILLRIVQPHSPHSQVAERALGALRRDHEKLHLASQNVFEFWAVSTRLLSENGLGLTVDQAWQEVLRLKRLFSLLPELPLLPEWERLVVAFRVSGKNSHDARLVATMAVHGVENILTFNVQDFARYVNIRVLDPRVIA
jgi:predicted nucleic acid-binding protein